MATEEMNSDERFKYLRIMWKRYRQTDRHLERLSRLGVVEQVRGVSVYPRRMQGQRGGSFRT